MKWALIKNKNNKIKVGKVWLFMYPRNLNVFYDPTLVNDASFLVEEVQNSLPEVGQRIRKKVQSPLYPYEYTYMNGVVIYVNKKHSWYRVEFDIHGYKKRISFKHPSVYNVYCNRGKFVEALRDIEVLPKKVLLDPNDHTEVRFKTPDHKGRSKFDCSAN